jgi:two-component system response regulator MprA
VPAPEDEAPAAELDAAPAPALEEPLAAADPLLVEELPEDPHPAVSAAAMRTSANGDFWIGRMPWMLHPKPDYLLNGCEPPAATRRYFGPAVHPRLLIAEDDPPLRDVLTRSLRAEGFAAVAVATGNELLARALADPPDALVIDIGLPDTDGRDLCQALRAGGIQAPVLFLTARDALTDRLSGFSAGGDDYVTKPFDIEEIVARLQALLRRSEIHDTPSVRGLILDPSQYSVSIGRRSETLTPTEFRLLAALAARPEKVLARRDLTRTAWPHGAIVHDNTLDVYIARIRRKLASLPGAPTIATLHGVGYRLQ